MSYQNQDSTGARKNARCTIEVGTTLQRDVPGAFYHDAVVEGILQPHFTIVLAWYHRARGQMQHFWFGAA